MSVAKSRRLPQLQVGVLAGELLHSIDFTFPQGRRTYPATGPIPSTEAKVRSPAQFTTFITGSIDMPPLQQHKIGLAIDATQLGGAMAREGVRQRRQKIAADVRAGYFGPVATQTAVDAARDAVKTLEEAQRVTARYEAQQTVLHADALDVDARPAKSRYGPVGRRARACDRARTPERAPRPRFFRLPRSACSACPRTTPAA